MFSTICISTWFWRHSSFIGSIMCGSASKAMNTFWATPLLIAFFTCLEPITFGLFFISCSDKSDILLRQIIPSTRQHYSLFAAHLDILAPESASVNQSFILNTKITTLYRRHLESTISCWYAAVSRKLFRCTIPPGQIPGEMLSLPFRLPRYCDTGGNRCRQV